MKTKLLLMIVTALLVSTCTAQVDINKLENLIATLRTYQYDKTQGVDLVWVETQVGMAAADKAVRDQVEEALIDSLAKAKTNDARQFLCRQLRTIGTAKSVPQLASMLTDPTISHMARYALGRIEAPCAGQAMHQALSRTSGNIKAGLINTLVQMDHVAASSDIKALVNDQNKEVSIAAIRGAGHFGGREAVKRLQSKRSSAARDVAVEIDDALLKCAHKFAAQGQKSQAVSIYSKFYRSDNPEHLRVAGLRGLTATQGDKATDLLIKAIQGSDAELRKNAIAMMAMNQGDKTTEALITLVRTIPADGQELIIRALALRGNMLVVPTLMDMTESDHEAVRLAAIEALGGVSTPKAITCLAQAAASGSGREKQTAQASLVRMSGKGIDKAFIRHIKTGALKNRVEIIRAIGQRSDHEPFDVLLKVAKAESDTNVRREAILSLGHIGQPSDLDVLVTLMITPNNARDRNAIERAIISIYNSMEDREAQARPVLEAMGLASDDAKIPFLKLLARPATTDALEAVYQAVSSPNSKVSDAAIRTLGDWPNAEPIEQLLGIAETSKNQIHKILSLRGYIRLTPLTKNPTACYVNALKLAKRDEEIRLVLSGLHHAGTLKALEIAESYMTHSALKTDAFMSAVKVASVFCWQDRVRAKTLLDRVIADAPNSNIRNQAQDVLRKMDAFKSTIAIWKGVGPFTRQGIHDGGSVFNTKFEPENDFDSKDITWRMIVPQFEGNGRIDLEKTFGRIDYCCAYLRTTIQSPIDQQAQLKWGVDDYITGWLNGKPTRDGAITLKQGANTFIVKVGDHGGGWNFQCELLQPDGAPIKGLTFKR